MAYQFKVYAAEIAGDSNIGLCPFEPFGEKGVIEPPPTRGEAVDVGHVRLLSLNQAVDSSLSPAGRAPRSLLRDEAFPAFSTGSPQALQVGRADSGWNSSPLH